VAAAFLKTTGVMILADPRPHFLILDLVQDFSEEEAYEGPGVGLPTAGSSTGPAARASSGSVTGTSQSQPLVQVQEEEVVEHAGQAGAPKQDIRLACLSTADRVLAFSMSFMRDGE
jgi:hypothetical protein